MEFRVDLSASALARLRGAVVEGETVGITFESSVYDIRRLYAVIKSSAGAVVKTPIADNHLDLTQYAAVAGEIDTEVHLIANGESVKRWRVEPIVVKSIDGVFAPIPEIEDMQARVDRLERGFYELVTKISESNKI